MTPTLPVAETFTSIQGEGSLTGLPSFFIRVAGCNLRCSWCDTPHASWSPAGRTHSLEELVDMARDSGVRHVVLTGGEPLLFPNIDPLSQHLARQGLHITIETAGTIAPSSKLHCNLMSISPKLSNSTPVKGDARDPGGKWHLLHEQRRFNPAALQALIDSFPLRQFKFVVTGPADLAEIDKLLDHLSGWQPHEIMLMPEGTTAPRREDSDYVVGECIRRNWRYCHRLHITLFGHTRGT